MVEMVRAWAEGLEELHGRISRRFVRDEPRRRALAYLKGLVGSSERKNGWRLAEAVGESTPDGVQRLLNAARWDADLVRDATCTSTWSSTSATKGGCLWWTRRAS